LCAGGAGQSGQDQCEQQSAGRVSRALSPLSVLWVHGPRSRQEKPPGAERPSAADRLQSAVILRVWISRFQRSFSWA
jgi:hypothetical protein